MSPKREWPWLIGAFAVCFVAGGTSCWRGSYLDYLDRGFSWETLSLPAPAAFFLPWIIGRRIVFSAIVVGRACPAIILTRVVLDGMKDPSSRNLWPFEVAMSFGLGMI